MDQSAGEADSKDAPSPPKEKKQKKAKASKPSSSPKASTRKTLKTAPPESSVQSEDLSRVSKRTKKPFPKKATGQPLTPYDVLRNEDEAIDLSSDEDLGDDALEMLIKSKQEAEIFDDLPLFDVDILNNFIDEWFDNQDISIDDFQLPVDISVIFHGAIAGELALAQKIVELKNNNDYEKAHFKKNMAKLSMADVQIFKKMLLDLKEEFHKKRTEAKGSC